ncbi:MAG: DUF4364 family protein [Bacteroidales bacterium]|jgi:hypothetical protein|nr:DUF4364 family protein [Bacteroidales bacterium]
MIRKKFLKSMGAIAAGAAITATGAGNVGQVMGTAMLQSAYKLGAVRRRFSIVYALNRIGDMTPDRLDRCLFESGLSEPFNLNAELSKMVEEGVLRQSVSTDGLVYKLTDASAAILSDIGKLKPEELSEINVSLDELKSRFEAESDYIAQYTESSTGVVPVFLSIRDGASILMKLNIIVPDVATARIVTRNWMKNAHRARHSVWESIGEGLPFPSFRPLEEGRKL